MLTPGSVIGSVLGGVSNPPKGKAESVDERIVIKAGTPQGQAY